MRNIISGRYKISSSVNGKRLADRLNDDRTVTGNAIDETLKCIRIVIAHRLSTIRQGKDKPERGAYLCFKVLCDK